MYDEGKPYQHELNRDHAHDEHPRPAPKDPFGSAENPPPENPASGSNANSESSSSDYRGTQPGDTTAHTNEAQDGGIDNDEFPHHQPATSSAKHDRSLFSDSDDEGPEGERPSKRQRHPTNAPDDTSDNADVEDQRSHKRDREWANLSDDCDEDPLTKRRRKSTEPSHQGYMTDSELEAWLEAEFDTLESHTDLQDKPPEDGDESDPDSENNDA